MEISYELLVAESHDLLIRLLEFGTRTLKRHSSEEIRRILTVNLALAHKWSGQNDSSLKILESLDWSACAAKFQLAVNVIREEFTAAAEQVRTIGSEGEVTEAAYQEWPLFKEFRKSDEFQAAFRHVFGRDFVLQEQVKGDDPSECDVGAEAAQQAVEPDVE